MDIQKIIENDPRIVEIAKQGQALTAQKHNLIMAISLLEADINKLMGVYQTTARQVVAEVTGTPLAAPAPVEPEGVTPVVPENEDDGFAEVEKVDSDPTEGPVDAETAR